MTFVISLITGLLAGALAGMLAFIGSGETRRGGWSFAIASGISFSVMFCVILFGMPTFAHWSDAGYVTVSLLILISGFGVGVFGGYEEYPSGRYDTGNGNWRFVFTTLIVLVALFVAQFSAITFFRGPNPCWVEPNRAVIKELLNFREFNTLEDTQESSVEKISDERSLQLAKNQQPQGLQLGEYLNVGESYEQIINGRPANVHALYPKDWGAYRRFGQKIPGFLVVDSTRTDGYAQWIGLPEGKEIRYASNDVAWGYDLGRLVYFGYELPHGVRVDEIAGVEVDDDYGFHYVGTIMKPSKLGGARYYMPAGIITVDPSTGEIKDYTLDEAKKELPWLDRIMPLDATTDLVKAYAKYQDNAAVCNWVTSAGQWELDSNPIITTRDGVQLFQYMLTTLNDEDPIVQEIVYVSPRTMESYRFPGDGMLWTPKTSDLVRKRANLNVASNQAPIEPKEPTLMWFGGQQFTVYVMERGTTFSGFGAIRADLARKESEKYVLTGDTIGQLSRFAVEQIAKIAPGSLDNEVAESSFEFRKTGVVDFIGTPYVETGEMKIIFTVRVIQEDDVVLYHFRANSRILAEELVGVGHEVTITAQAVDDDPAVIAEVSTIVNESYPPRTPTPTQ